MTFPSFSINNNPIILELGCGEGEYTDRYIDTDSDDTDSVEEVPDNSHNAADMDVSIEIQEKITNTNQRVLATPVARRIAY